MKIRQILLVLLLALGLSTVVAAFQYDDYWGSSPTTTN
jgi:hypothetical protein